MKVARLYRSPKVSLRPSALSTFLWNQPLLYSRHPEPFDEHPHAT